MKKLFTFIVAGMLLSLTMAAQIVEPKGLFMQRFASSPSRANLNENQMIMGHYDSDALSTDGFRVANNLVGVIPVCTEITPEELNFFKGGKIVAFRVGLAASTAISRVFVIPVDANGALGSTVQWTCSASAKGWNTIELATPYEINLPEGYGLRIGFDFKQTSGNYALSAVKEGVIYPTYFFRNKWFNSGLDREGGNLSVQCIVENDNYPEYYVENNNLKVSNFVKQGEEVKFSFTTRNHGTGTIAPSGCTYNVMIDGNQVATISNTEALTLSNVELYAAVQPGELSKGLHTLTVATAAINGEPVDYQSTVSATFRIYESGFAHQMHLIEQFTAIGCTYCPLGIGLLKQLQATRGDIAWVGIHGNMGEDPFITAQGDSIMSYEGCTGYPTGSFDRLPGFEEDGSIVAGLGYYENYYNDAVAAISQFLDMGSEEPAWAQVNISSTFDAASRQAVITVGGEMVDVFDEMIGADSRLTVYLTEDGLIERQLNAGTWIEEFEHNGVFRMALGSVKGVALNRDGNSYSNQFTVTIPENWNADKLNIVAFISRPIAQGNYNDMRVNNANMNKLGAAAAPVVERGDANHDGELDVADVVAIIEFLLSNDDSPIDLDAADTTLDGEHDIADVTLLITYLLENKW